MKIVHVVPRLVHGGAVRSTIDLAHEQARAHGVRGTIIVLGASHVDTFAWARGAGLDVVLPDAPEAQARLLREADIVHVAFWNTPEMYAWLRAPIPPARLVITLHVLGQHPAQSLPTPLLRMADRLIPTCVRTTRLPVFRETMETRPERVTVIPGSERWSAAPQGSHARTHRVGYVGSVDFAKMHSSFLAMCAAVNLPEINFPIAGSGNAVKTLMRQADELNLSSRIEWLGYQTDVSGLLASLDVLGYPLTPRTYATSDLVVQQAMWQGIPPVVLPYGGAADLIVHDETGMVVSEQEYPRAVRELVSDDSKRARLGDNARTYAREHFGIEHRARALLGVYENAMSHPKIERAWQCGKETLPWRGADALIESFGDAAGCYCTSAQGSDIEDVRAAESRIAFAPPVETDTGGILDYRKAYPDDPLLRLWSGLVLAQQKRFALAAGEFTAAKKLGLAAERVSAYLERVMAHESPFEETTA